MYSFICKFTNLRHRIEGLESPMECVSTIICTDTSGLLLVHLYSLEEALMSKEPNTILSQILAAFMINLKPQTRNLR